VVEVGATFHPTGRFLVKDYPKDGEYRRLRLTGQVVAKLQAYVRERELADGDLVVAMRGHAPALKMLANPDRLGRTEAKAAGRTYRHGALSAYTADAAGARNRTLAMFSGYTSPGRWARGAEDLDRAFGRVTDWHQSSNSQDR
jgi:hypothetical protein